jgi:hypothetical protein
MSAAIKNGLVQAHNISQIVGWGYIFSLLTSNMYDKATGTIRMD